MTKGDQKNWKVNLEWGKDKSHPAGSGKKMLPKPKPKPKPKKPSSMTIKEFERWLKQDSQRQRGPRIRGKKAIT